MCVTVCVSVLSVFISLIYSVQPRIKKGSFCQVLLLEVQGDLCPQLLARTIISNLRAVPGFLAKNAVGLCRKVPSWPYHKSSGQPILVFVLMS